MTVYPWRYRCPDGHAGIDMGVTAFWCESCGESYPKADLVDLADV